MNHFGAAIFWLYIVFALAFTGITLRTTYRLYNAYKPKKSQRRGGTIGLFLSLALLSFTTLSSNMLTVLIESFKAWTVGRDPAELASLPLAVWNWSITSSLFRDFGEAIVENTARFLWVQNALLATLSIFFFMGAEGRHRGVPQLWSFFCLSQILPISFAQNLFYVALLLSPDKGGRFHFSKTTSVLSAAVYCICLAFAQEVAGTEKLIPIILVARLVLMAPLLLEGRGDASSPSEQTSVDRATGDELQRIILKTAFIMTGFRAYQAVQEGWTIQAIGDALFSHPAVASLGCDFFISALSFAAWTVLRARSDPSTPANGPRAASATTTATTKRTTKGRKKA